jgi:hypothetical protein
MNKVFLQIWEETERSWGIRPDGCSIHIDSDSHKKYIDNIYSNRGDNVPDIYERINGDVIIAFVEDGLYKELIEKKSIRILEHEFNNLTSMEELIIKQ